MPKIDVKQTYPEELARMASGRMTSAILEAAMELDVFSKLGRGPVQVKELKKRWGMPSTSARMLAQQLCTLGLLRYRNGKISLTPWGRQCQSLPNEDKTWLRNMCHIGFSWWAVREHLLHPRTQEWYAIRDKGDSIRTHFYTDTSTHKLRIKWGQQLAAQFNFAPYHSLLDVGGASGGWAIGIRQKFPHMRATVFEIEQVSWITQHMIESSGHGNHIDVFTGSFFECVFPKGHDVILFANVLHDWTPQECRKLLQKALRCLPNKGVVLVNEFFFNDDWTGPVDAAIQAASVLGPERQSGWQPSYREMMQLLKQSGFKGVEQRENLVLGRKHAP